MAIFRIAHISDLHLSNTRDRLNPLETVDTALDRAFMALRLVCKSGRLQGATYPSTFETLPAIRLLRELDSDDLDGVIVTGDVATTGRIADLEIARAYFEAKLPKDWRPVSDSSLPSLLRDGFPVLTLPGNHDRYEGSFNTPGSNNFERVLGIHWDLNRGYARPVGRSGRVRIAKFSRGGKTLAVVLIDLSLTDRTAAQGGITNYVGQGRAIPEPLRVAEAATTTMRAEYAERGEKIAILWAVHFPPGFPGVARELELIEATELLHSTWAISVPVILAGHTHEHRVYDIQHPHSASRKVRVICCGATTGVSTHNHHSYSILEIDNEGDDWHLTSKTYTWDGESFAAS